MENKKKSFNFLNLFDFYGINFPLRYRKKPRFATKLGIILSLITVIFSVIVVSIYLVQLIDRSYFELYNYKEKETREIDFSNIPLMVGLYDSFGNSIKIDTNYIEIQIDNNDHQIIQTNETRVIKRISNKIEIESCDNYFNSLNISYKNELINYLNQQRIENNICVKQGQKLTFSGRYGDIINGFNILEIHLNRCNSTKENNTCKSNDEINNYLQNLYFSVIYLENGIDHSNYKEPIYNKFRIESVGIFPQILKRVYYFIRSGIYNSDNGILFSSINKKNFYEYKDKYIDQVKEEDETYYNNLSILEFAFSSFDYIKIYKRYYRKITDVCAIIGGWIDFLFIIFQFITQYFSRKTLIVDITNHLICSRCKNHCDIEYHNVNTNKNFFHFNNKVSNNCDWSSKSNNTSLYNLKCKIEQNDKDNIKAMNSIKSSSIIEIKNKKKIIPKIKVQNENIVNSSNKTNIKKNSINISNLDIGNPVLQKYFEESRKKGECKNQRYQISFFDYILPFSCLKKQSNYNLLILYTNVVDTFLSLEHYLPMTEGFNRMYYREDDNYRAKFKGALFRLQNYDEY